MNNNGCLFSKKNGALFYSSQTILFFYSTNTLQRDNMRSFEVFWQMKKSHATLKNIIIKIDLVTPSFCLHHYVRNGLSYLAEETQPTLCKPTPSSQLGIRSKRTNKHQLLHRITSVKTPQI